MERTARNGHLEVVKLLHDIGATCTPTAIHLALVHGHHDVYHFLNTVYPGKVCCSLNPTQKSYVESSQVTNPGHGRCDRSKEKAK